MMRRVMRERAVALSGPRALLMQAAHPLAVGTLANSTMTTAATTTSLAIATAMSGWTNLAGSRL